MNTARIRDDLEHPGRKPALAICAMALLVFAATMALPRFSLFAQGHGSMLSVHLVLELFSVIVCVLVVVTAWNTLNKLYFRISNTMVFGFSVVAGCDLLHALTYEGMPSLLHEGNTPEAIFFWLAGRSFGVVTVALMGLRVVLPGSRAQWQGAALATLAVLFWMGNYGLDWMPATFVPGQGVTPFKGYFEMGLCAANLLMAAWYWHESAQEAQPRAIWLAASCFVMGIGGLLFSTYVAPSDFLNFMGHVFKVVSYALIFKATYMVSVKTPFAMLAESKRLLKIKQLELDSIMRNMRAGVTRLDTDMRIVYLNEIQAQFFGHTVQQAIGKPMQQVLDPRQYAYIRQKTLQALAGETVEIETYTADSSGTPRSYRSVTITPERDLKGSIIGCVAVSIDMTEKRLTDQKLRASMQEVYELTSALDAHAIVAVTDARGVITRVNDKFCQISQYPRSELIGNTHKVINSTYHPPEFFHDLWRTIRRGDVWNGEICNRAKDGSLYWVYTTIVPFIGADGIPVQYIAIRADITERKRVEQEAQSLAFFDVLTGLPNRRLLMERLQFSMSTSQRTPQYGALMFLDLDHFKGVNDTLGHDKGDQLLNCVAQRISQCVREVDTVARFGGDEFVILLNELGASEEDATRSIGTVSKKILQAFGNVFALDGHEAQCGVSMGVTLFRGTSVAQDDLLRQADIALYQAKDGGRNRMCFFDPLLQLAVNERASLESQLRHAIGNGELELHYQPLVDQNMQTTGAEALIRWRHPERGLISPAVFIPLAEKSNLILDLGRWVLDTACAQLAAWSRDASTRDLSIAVNVSGRQFHQDDFVESVMSALHDHAARADRLKLEITESMLLNDLDRTIQKMQTLKDHGVRFSLDDFGTGYSSLSYLKKLPLDLLKIDQSFVREVESNANDAAIARTIISLARTLDLSVVAEGVETMGQLEFLRSCGCMAFQGYLLSRPVPIHVLERGLERGFKPSVPDALTLAVA